MTLTEAAGIVTRIARYYPTWLKNLDEEEVSATFRAWAGELAPLGDCATVWRHTLEALRSSPNPWPPGIFELRAFVRRRIEHENLRVKCVPAAPPSGEERENAARWLGEIRKKLGGGERAPVPGKGEGC